MLGYTLVVQWLGLCILIAGGLDSIPSWEIQDAWLEGKTMILLFQANLLLFKGRLLYIWKMYNIILDFTMINGEH